jgi:hypothetical protein
MYEITPSEKIQFENLGYLVIPMHVDRSDITAALKGAEKMRHQAIHKQYPLTRTYYDHLSSWNIAAIEAPFNKSILDSRVRVLFEKLNLGTTVCSLMGWANSYCSLARLFTMGNYKYRGNWHRDNEITPFETPQKCTNVVQVELYLEAQHGFRYLKKDYDLGGVKSIISNLNESKAIQSFPFPLSPPKESFESLGGEAGTMLLFNPTRIHQGSTYGGRLDFHMRFQNISNMDAPHDQLIQNHFLDFKCLPELGEHANPLEIAEEKLLPRTEPRRLKNRIVNSINYWTCLNNLKRIRESKFSKNMLPLYWTPDLRSNTFFQK